MNDGLDSIIFYFWFYLLFLIFLDLILSFLFSFFILDLGRRSGVILYMAVTQVKKCDIDMTYVTLTPSCDTEKIIEGARTDNII